MIGGVLLGIDGGGTSTTAWIADLKGSILGRGHAGPSNLKAIGTGASKAALDLAIARAFTEAKIEPKPAEVACLGLAGFDRIEEKRLLEVWSEESAWAKQLVLVNDGDLVLAAGTPEGWGVGVIAGTGSIAVGRSKIGQSARAGGWGYLLGDEGSGYAVALAGLRKVARRADGRESFEGGQDDSLTRLLCEKLGISDPSGLVAAIYRPEFDRAKIASLAPMVVEAARSDRSIFDEILEPAGSELARMVLAVASQLGIEPGPLPLAKAGSFLLKARSISDVLDDRLRREGFSLTTSEVPEPVEGAILLALRTSSQ
jgi:N-acetylglucosamine kinase-like BadF-type ATPase